MYGITLEQVAAIRESLDLGETVEVAGWTIQPSGSKWSHDQVVIMTMTSHDGGYIVEWVEDDSTRCCLSLHWLEVLMEYPS